MSKRLTKEDIWNARSLALGIGLVIGIMVVIGVVVYLLGYGMPGWVPLVSAAIGIPLWALILLSRKT